MQHLSIQNATNTATAWAASPAGQLVRVEVLVTLSCILLVTMVFLGSSRRASRSVAFRLVVWSALMLSYPAVSYTIGLMQSSSFRNELVVVWACFLLACADGISACSIDDSDQQARSMLNQAAQIIYVLFLLLSHASSLLLQLKVLLLLIWLQTVAKLGVRIKNFLSVGRDRVLSIENRLITMYMQDGNRCGLLVTGEEGLEDGRGEYRFSESNLPANLVTFDMVWHCKGILLNKDSPRACKLKDLCLSFALFKLLRRRLTSDGGRHGLTRQETHNFPNNGTGNDDDGQERLFHVIEVELGFLFDFFYARHPCPRETLVPETVLFMVVLTTSLSTLFVPALLKLNYHTPNGDPNISTTGLDIRLTRMVIVLFLLLESFQYSKVVFSDWHKVKMLCRYVRDPWWQKQVILEFLLSLMFRVTLTRRYWSKSVGQYCLLQTCIRSENELIFRLPLPDSFRRFLVKRRMKTHRDLSKAVKRAIYHPLNDLSYHSRMAHGLWALQSPYLHTDELCQNITRQSIIRSMLVWHIATTICDYELGTSSAPIDGIITENHEVATTLSNYCAYLLFYALELVIENHRSTQISLEFLQITVQRCLGGCQSKLFSFQPMDDSDRYEAILADGGKLGRDILRIFPDKRARWTMLAKLWAEKVLSVAPSNNVAAHVKKLATGGELITHIWAWLTHCGIIKQPTKPFYEDQELDLDYAFN
ncbi:unnamed protein product [Urochloa humidicola]